MAEVLGSALMPFIGQMYITPPASSTTRCKLYDNPPVEGRYLRTFAPGEVFGPVLDCVASSRFITVRIEDGWVNVLAYRGRTGQWVPYAQVIGHDYRASVTTN